MGSSAAESPRKSGTLPQKAIPKSPTMVKSSNSRRATASMTPKRMLMPRPPLKRIHTDQLWPTMQATPAAICWPISKSRAWATQMGVAPLSTSTTPVATAIRRPTTWAALLDPTEPEPWSLRSTPRRALTTRYATGIAPQK